MISQKPIPFQPVLKNKERNFKTSWIVPIFTPNLPVSAHLVSLQITQLSHLWLWFSVLQIKVTPFISERKKCPCNIPSHMVKHPQTKQDKHTNLIYRFPSANFTIVLIVILKGWQHVLDEPRKEKYIYLVYKVVEQQMCQKCYTSMALWFIKQKGHVKSF